MFKKTTSHRPFAAALLAGVALGLPLAALSQGTADAFPQKPVTLIVPFPPGGVTDSVTRQLALKLSEEWKQPVVVENRAGALGTVAQNYMLNNAPADGYTVMLGITSFVYQSSLRSDAPDFATVFAPVAMVGEVRQALVVSSTVPATNLQDFVALVKANPRKYSFGSAGTASTAHIYGEMLNAQAKIDLTHVSYRGYAPLMTDVLGGQIPSGFIDVAVIGQHIKSGKFKVLAIAPTRAPELPDVPSFTELGYKNFEAGAFVGYFVSAKTPQPLIDKLSRDIVRVAAMPEIAQKITELGLGTTPLRSAEFDKQVRSGKSVWERTINEQKIKLE